MLPTQIHEPTIRVTELSVQSLFLHEQINLAQSISIKVIKPAFEMILNQQL